jgi:hypothetical protein
MGKYMGEYILEGRGAWWVSVFPSDPPSIPIESPPGIRHQIRHPKVARTFPVHVEGMTNCGPRFPSFGPTWW